MKRLLTAVVLCILLGQRQAGAQCHETAKTMCVSPLLITAALGYAQIGVTDLGNLPNREGTGFNVRADAHMISFLLRHKALPFRISDALYADATAGRMTSDTLAGGFFGSEPSGGFAVSFGYQFLAGLQRGNFALLGGLGKREYDQEVGGATMSGSTTPLIGRFEIGKAKPIFLTAFVSMSGDKSSGARIDIPLFRRLNATVDYWKIKGAAELWNSASGQKVPATATSFMIGIRTRELK